MWEFPSTTSLLLSNQGRFSVDGRGTLRKIKGNLKYMNELVYFLDPGVSGMFLSLAQLSRLSLSYGVENFLLCLLAR